MEIRVDRQAVARAREYRKQVELAVERSGNTSLFFIAGRGCYPYLRAVAIQAAAIQWSRQGHAIDYLATEEELVAEAESAILTSSAWAEAQDKAAGEIPRYLWGAARWTLKGYVERLIRDDRRETSLVGVNSEGDEFCTADVADLPSHPDWENSHEPTAEQAALAGESEPWYALRAAQAIVGDLIRALQAEEHGDLALRWLEGESVEALAAELGTSCRTVRNRIFGYSPSVRARMRDGRGALERACEAAEVDLEPSAAGFESLRAAHRAAK